MLKTIPYASLLSKPLVQGLLTILQFVGEAQSVPHTPHPSPAVTSQTLLPQVKVDSKVSARLRSMSVYHNFERMSEDGCEIIASM